MAMDLNAGGHLTHGSKVSITGKLWKQVPYGVHPRTKMIDYDALTRLAKRENPKLVIAGGSAYSRSLDFKKFKTIAKGVKALFMVDMSHFAGLVAGGAYPSPFPYADIVTTTTHKTLRGPRAAIIFSRKSDAKLKTVNSQLTISEAVDKAVFPGIQGGPHANTIAAMGVALKEAQAKSFRVYAKQTVKNARTLARTLSKRGWRIVSESTDSHLFLMDTARHGVHGKEAGELLEAVGIIVNKNVLPFDTRTPHDPSGIRIGTAAITTRGMKESEMKIIAELIHRTLLKEESPAAIAEEAKKLTKQFPIPSVFK